MEIDNNDNKLDSAPSNAAFYERRTDYSKQLINDSTIDESLSNTPWMNTTELNSIEDLETEIADQHLNYKLIGDTETFSINDSPINSSTDTDWVSAVNPDFPAFPEWPDDGDPETNGAFHDSYGIDEHGVWANHSWYESAKQTPSVNWVDSFSVPVNMSEYTITDAQISAVANGTAIAYGNTWDDGAIDNEGDTTAGSNLLATQAVTYDYVRFYINIADLSRTTEYTLAEYQTYHLGVSNGTQTTDIQKNLIAEATENLKFYISSVLAVDDFNFKLILGMDIVCEDSLSSDIDIWEMLRIKSLDFSFTYQKNIEQASYASWSETGYKINQTSYEDNEIEISRANLNFDYMLDQPWISESPNSEIRVVINNITHTETVKISNATTTPQSVYEGEGFDVLDYIDPDENITIEIICYIADNFELDHNITLTIDNISLEVNYTLVENLPLQPTELLIDGALSRSVTLNSDFEIFFNYTLESSGDLIDVGIFDITWLNKNYTTTLENIGTGEYKIIANTTDLQTEQTYDLIIDASGNETHIATSQTIQITVSKINTAISSTTGSNIVKTFHEGDATLSVEIENLDFGGSVLDLNVTYDWAGGTDFLLDPEDDGTYEVILQNIDEGYYPVTIDVWVHENYTFSSYTMYVNSSRDLLTPTLMELSFDGVDYTETPEISLPIGSTLNITISYFNTSQDYIIGATIRFIQEGYADLIFTENVGLDEYSLNLTADTTLERFSLGNNDFQIEAYKVGYVINTTDPRVIIRKRLTLIESTTASNEVKTHHEGDVTLSVDVTDLDFGGSVLDLNVTYDWAGGTGFLLDPEDDGVYVILLQDIDEGYYPVTIDVWVHENYTFSSYTMYVNSSRDLLTPTLMELSFDGVDYTQTPEISLPIGSTLNITIIYTDTSHDHITGANIRLIQEGYIDLIFTENVGLEEYTLNLTADITLERFSLGNNDFQIEAYKVGYVINITDPRVIIRKRLTLIESTTASNEVKTHHEGDVTLSVDVTDLDFGGSVLDLNVTYDWAGGTGFLLDPEDDGVYVILLQDIDEGYYPVTIDVWVHENYTFSSYTMYVNSSRDLLTPTLMELSFDGVDYTQTPEISLPIGSTLNITIIYTDTSHDHITGANIRLIQEGYIDLIFTENVGLEEYTLNLTADITLERFSLGNNDFQIEAYKVGYVINITDPRVIIRKRLTLIESTTASNEVKTHHEGNVTLSVDVTDLDFGGSVLDLNVTYDWAGGTGFLLDPEDDGVYVILLQDIDEGYYPVTIDVWVHENYTFSSYTMYVNSSRDLLTPTLMELSFDGVDYTQTPEISLPIGSTLNITIIYTDTSHDHITGANIRLLQDGFVDLLLTENLALEHYSIIISESTIADRFSLGNNDFHIEAYKVGYVINTIDPRVTLRKRNTEIDSTSGSTIIPIYPEGDAPIQLNISDTDFGGSITNLTVTFSNAELGTGLFLDNDNDGIYDATIYSVAEGTYLISISVLNHENYTFDSFDVTVTALDHLLYPTILEIYMNGANLTEYPSLNLPVGSELNLTVIYANVTGEYIPGAEIKLIRNGFEILYFTEYPLLEQYSLILDVDSELVKGLNLVEIRAKQLGHEESTSNPSITIRKIDTEIESLSGSTINIKSELNATFQIQINNLDFGGTIEGMTVTFDCELDSGRLAESGSTGIYEFSIYNVPEGNYPIVISVLSHENYTFSDIELSLSALSSLLDDTYYHIYFNGNETSHDPSIELPVGSTLNITIKFYENDTNSFISGALVQIEKIGYIEILNESASHNQYSILLNVNDIFDRGTNILNIFIKKVGFHSQSIDARIIIRQIFTQISSETGPNRIDIKPKESITLQIRLNNLDAGETITDVTVVYSWEFGQGTLTDLDGDGVYEVDFEEVPAGTYTILITVYAGDDYIFDTYEITLAVQKDPGDLLIENIIMYAASIGVLGLMTYVTIYQTKLKYPDDVRKLRKLRKAVRRGQTVRIPVDVPKRQDILVEKLNSDLECIGVKNSGISKQDVDLFMTQSDLQVAKQKQLEEERKKAEKLRNKTVKLNQNNSKIESENRIKKLKEKRNNEEEMK